MSFTDHQEKIIEKVLVILQKSERTIINEFTRFDVVYIGGIEPDRVRFEIQPTMPLISKILNFDLIRFFQDPYYCFEKTFEYRIWHYENIPDDMPFIGIYEMDYGIHCLEFSMFGIQPKWVPGKYPGYGDPIIKSKSDLKNIAIPDFFTAGYMPHLIENYWNLKQELNGRLEIGIRKFIQGPFQIASGLLGKEKAYEAIIADPGLITQLMDIHYAFHKNWVAGWEKLHGRDYGMANIGEETIDTNLRIPPQIFKEVILPYHIAIGQEFDQVHWHSCRDVNAIIPMLKEIPNLAVVEIGPATDTLQTVKALQSKDVMFYKIPDPETELLNPEPGAQEEMIHEVLEAGKISPIKILLETPEIEPALKLLELFRKLSTQ